MDLLSFWLTERRRQILNATWGGRHHGKAMLLSHTTEPRLLMPPEGDSGCASQQQ